MLCNVKKLELKSRELWFKDLLQELNREKRLIQFPLAFCLLPNAIPNVDASLLLPGMTALPSLLRRGLSYRLEGRIGAPPRWVFLHKRTRTDLSMESRAQSTGEIHSAESKYSLNQSVSDVQALPFPRSFVSFDEAPFGHKVPAQLEPPRYEMERPGRLSPNPSFSPKEFLKLHGNVIIHSSTKHYEKHFTYLGGLITYVLSCPQTTPPVDTFTSLVNPDWERAGLKKVKSSIPHYFPRMPEDNIEAWKMFSLDTLELEATQYIGTLVEHKKTLTTLGMTPTMLNFLRGMENQLLTPLEQEKMLIYIKSKNSGPFGAQQRMHKTPLPMLLGRDAFTISRCPMNMKNSFFQMMILWRWQVELG
ncbi:unnamed protein product [Darwinula stevensoni]|uniref:Uncharacterized protein n=1 Tax=Darwinula stevensoni TaxID=69355 RepID=A0A7R9FQB4_9CRUS|nr:unnamed protein product [Darwinula stevensoni]CAG0899165.1 unnamed protein product [Darwinula stevensoni]